MPLDPEPVEDGNVVVLDGVALVLTKADTEGVTLLAELIDRSDRFISHFATCNKQPRRGPPNRQRKDKRR